MGISIQGKTADSRVTDHSRERNSDDEKARQKSKEHC